MKLFLFFSLITAAAVRVNLHLKNRMKNQTQGQVPNFPSSKLVSCIYLEFSSVTSDITLILMGRCNDMFSVVSRYLFYMSTNSQRLETFTDQILG